MNDNQLFRQEVFASQRNKNYGSVSMNTPISFMVMAVGTFMIIMCILFFILFGEFSEKFIVRGFLESTKGVARIYTLKSGVVVKQFIKQGDEVKKGQKLYLIDTSFEGGHQKNHPDVFSQLSQRHELLQKQILLKEKHLQQLKVLLEKKYISLSAYHEKQDELVALKNQQSEVRVEMIHEEDQKSYLIRAPIDGVVASLMFQEGQYVHLSKPLASILPTHADLMANLYIPVSQFGFLAPQNKVIIRYDAYPYARFGTSKAMIRDIGRSILTDEDEVKPIRIEQPYYKVSALLEKQVVMAYGKERKIQHGMTLTAVIIGSKKKVWQWILDPLFSVYGGLTQ